MQRRQSLFLKDKKTLFQKHDGHLFGKKFCVHVIETEKLNKKTMEVFKKVLICQVVENPF